MKNGNRSNIDMRTRLQKRRGSSDALQAFLAPPLSKFGEIGSSNMAESGFGNLNIVGADL